MGFEMQFALVWNGSALFANGSLLVLVIASRHG
jgi:hypothetical protein